jgi:hypothetical protein
MHEDRRAAEDSLLLFPSEPEHPVRRSAPREDAALAEFLSEPDQSPAPPLPVASPDPLPRKAQAWLLRFGPAWSVGAAAVLCALAVLAAAWSTRAGGTDSESLRHATLERLGGMPPSDRSSTADLPVRSNPGEVSASSRAPAGAAVENRDGRPPGREVESLPSDDAVMGVSAGMTARGTDPSTPPVTPAEPSTIETFTAAVPAPDETGLEDPIPATAVPAASPGVEPAALPAVEMRAASRPADVSDASVPADTDAVRRTLDAYRAAYERLDVGAAVEVWPTVDRRALARAFSTLESQDVRLGECDIEVAEATAIARCQGTVRFVRAFGSRDPVNAPTGWVFRMRKSGASWTIEDVTGAEASRD